MVQSFAFLQCINYRSDVKKHFFLHMPMVLTKLRTIGVLFFSSHPNRENGRIKERFSGLLKAMTLSASPIK